MQSIVEEAASVSEHSNSLHIGEMKQRGVGCKEALGDVSLVVIDHVCAHVARTWSDLSVCDRQLCLVISTMMEAPETLLRHQ